MFVKYELSIFCNFKAITKFFKVFDIEKVILLGEAGHSYILKHGQIKKVASPPKKRTCKKKLFIGGRWVSGLGDC